MFCRNCGNRLNDTDLFCPNCGAKNESTKIEETVVTEKEASIIYEQSSDISGDMENIDFLDISETEEMQESKFQVFMNKKALINTALSICALGVILFMGIVIVGLIGWGEVYLFGGYDFTTILTTISMVLMLFGALMIGSIILIRAIIKIRPVIYSKKIFVFVAILLVLSLGFSTWGFVDHDNESSYASSNGGNYTTYTTLFSAYYDNNCEAPYASYGGSYIKIDTNPYDYDGDSSNATTYSSIALAKIIGINSTLGFPSYVYQDMISTRALDGRQYYTGTRFSASWRYHPDSGLEVMYTEN